MYSHDLSIGQVRVSNGKTVSGWQMFGVHAIVQIPG